MERSLSLVASAFGVVALLLAAIGLYGVVAFAVARRTAEMGVRLALGASRRAVLRLVLADSAKVIVPGAVVGLAAALAATRLVAVASSTASSRPIRRRWRGGRSCCWLVAAWPPTFRPGARRESTRSRRCAANEGTVENDELANSNGEGSAGNRASFTEFAVQFVVRRSLQHHDRPLQVRHRAPGDLDAIAREPAAQAAPRFDSCMRRQLGLAEARRPVRRQRRVRRAGDRVLVARPPAGAKKRDTKSTSRPGAVTMMPRAGTIARSAKSGASAVTSSSPP